MMNEPSQEIATYLEFKVGPFQQLMHREIVRRRRKKMKERRREREKEQLRTEKERRRERKIVWREREKVRLLGEKGNTTKMRHRRMCVCVSVCVEKIYL